MTARRRGRGQPRGVVCSKYSISIYIYINLASVNTALLHHTAAGGETAVGGDDGCGAAAADC